MAKKYVISSTDTVESVKNALNDKGLITQVFYQSSNDLIFSSPICPKVIRLYFLPSGSNIYFRAYYGDAWTSGTNMTNSVQFLVADTSNDNAFTIAFLVADIDYFAILWCTGTTAAYGLCYVGALSNGKALAFGFSNNNSATNIAINLTDMVRLNPIVLSTKGFKDSNGNIFAMPLMWASDTGYIERDGIDIAETVGIKMSSLTSTSNTGYIETSTYILTPSLFYCDLLPIYTAMLLEFTE